MRNISRALKPGGRLMFVTWRAVEHNPWAGLPKAVVLKFLPPPGEDAQTCGPGPFSMANTDIVRAQLKAAGFDDIAFQAIDGPVMIGSTVEQALQFQLALGPAGEIFREAGEQATRRQPKPRYRPSWLAIASPTARLSCNRVPGRSRPAGPASDRCGNST
jgi:hypothetical protein